jgi:glyoxylase-like metal-dependent hydrolase (beta-lactamase superfamily II)
MLKVGIYKVGILETNCYIITDQVTKESAIIDPGFADENVNIEIVNLGAENIKYIIMTHGHFDHILAASYYKEMTGAKTVICIKDAMFIQDNELNRGFGDLEVEVFKPDILMKDEDELLLGNTKIKMIETPGHTVGSSCFIADDKMFTGDTLMKGTIGRTDFKTGDESAMVESIKRLKALNINYKIYPGHGDPSTLSYERENNVFLKQV